MRKELIEIGLKLGIEPSRLEEISTQAKKYGEATETNIQWLKKIIESDMVDREKVFVSFVIGGVLVEEQIKYEAKQAKQVPAQDNIDPMFV